MDAGTDVEVPLPCTADDRPSTRGCSRGAIEAAEEAVARGVDLLDSGVPSLGGGWALLDGDSQTSEEGSIAVTDREKSRLG